MKKTNSLRYLAIALCVFAILGFGFLIYFNTYMSKTSRIGMDVNVGNVTGFNVDADAIHFGTLTKGSAGKRELNLTGDEFRRKVYLFKKGEFSDWVYFSENKFYLEPHESKLIEVTAVIPNEAEFGSYKGEIIVMMVKK